MSAVAKPLADAFTSAMAQAVTKTAGAWLKAEDGVTKSRVNFGRSVGRAKAAIIAAGGSEDDAESTIWPVIVEAIGVRVEWKTIMEWVRAANVADSLDPKVAAVFSTEALKTIGRVPVTLSDKDKSEGRLSREEFAALAVENEVTSVRDLRKAVADERKSTSPKKQKSNASQAEETVQAMKGLVSIETAARIADVETETIIALVMIGVMLRDKVQKHGIEAVTEGVTEFFTPETVAAATEDGSEAPDA